MWKVIRFLARFCIDLWHALYFAAIEYDVKLQSTKTEGERLLIWFAVILLVIFTIMAFIYGVWHALDALQVPAISLLLSVDFV